MIQIQDNFLSDKDISYILNQWDDQLADFAHKIIHFFYFSFKKHNIDLKPIKGGVFPNRLFDKIRLQKYNETFIQESEFHEHGNFYNYIAFLNDDFKGGELEFKNGVTVKPKKGSLVYFNNNEEHRVLPCKGDRWVFALSGNEHIDLNIKYKTKPTI